MIPTLLGQVLTMYNTMCICVDASFVSSAKQFDFAVLHTAVSLLTFGINWLNCCKETIQISEVF